MESPINLSSLRTRRGGKRTADTPGVPIQEPKRRKPDSALQWLTMAADFPTDWTSSTLRVRYAETDQMGIVYYADFFV